MARAGELPFRAEQLFRWLHGPGAGGMGGVRIPHAPSTVPRALRDALLADAPLVPLALDRTVVSTDGTRKFRFRTHDDRAVETVLIPDDKQERSKLTLCISCQVGCAWGCAFCATATLGFGRNLSAGEMVEQLYWAMESNGQKPTNIVFMGMGEPLANYDNLWAAIERLHDDVGMSARHLTVSTVGIVPGIKRLAVASLPVNLAVSLHAANDELRDELVPINRRYPLAVLQEACAAYIAATRRRLSFEWALIDGVNDTRKDARELAGIARDLGAHVNLIPLNPTPGYAVRGTPAAGVGDFRDQLRSLGVNATVRSTRGVEIDAACGQLAGSTPVTLGVPGVLADGQH